MFYDTFSRAATTHEVSSLAVDNIVIYCKHRTNQHNKQTAYRKRFIVHMTRENPNFPHEEYNLLTGASAPGTVMNIYKKKSVVRNPKDVALADLMYGARPSGVVLPKILRRKLRLLKKSLALSDDDKKMSPSGDMDNADETHEELFDRLGMSEEGKNYFESGFTAMNNMDYVPLNDRIAHYDAKKLHSKSPITSTVAKYEEFQDIDKDDVKAHIPPGYEAPMSFRNINRSRVFTTTELEKKLSRANAALLDIQKQLVRGEEIYYHDTEQHGNMHKGWDVFIDGALNHLGIDQYIDSKEDDISVIQNSSAPTRRLNSDHRWFSSSCYVIENNQFRPLPKRKKPNLIKLQDFDQATSNSFCPKQEKDIKPADARSDNVLALQKNDNIQPEQEPSDATTQSLANSVKDGMNIEIDVEKPNEETATKQNDDIIEKEDELKSPERISRKRKKDTDDDDENVNVKEEDHDKAVGGEGSKNTSRSTRSSKRRK